MADESVSLQTETFNLETIDLFEVSRYLGDDAWGSFKVTLATLKLFLNSLTVQSYSFAVAGTNTYTPAVNELVLLFVNTDKASESDTISITKTVDDSVVCAETDETARIFMYLSNDATALNRRLNITVSAACEVKLVTIKL